MKVSSTLFLFSSMFVGSAHGQFNPGSTECVLSGSTKYFCECSQGRVTWGDGLSLSRGKTFTCPTETGAGVVNGQLATFDSSEEMLALGPRTATLWVGLKREGTTWTWIDGDGGVPSTQGLPWWWPTFPKIDEGKDCADMISDGTIPLHFNNRYCDGYENYLAEFDCSQDTAPGPAPGDGWSVDFTSAAATFDGSANGVTLQYSGAKPSGTGTGKYYKVQIMDPTCTTFVSSDAITPTDTDGLIPEAYYDLASTTLTATLDIDTSTIESSSNFYTAGASPEEFTIKFCVKMELLNEDNIAVSMENTIVTFDVDTTQAFEIAGFAAAAETSSADETVLVDFPLNTFVCDDANQEVTTPNILPGDTIQFCVSTSASDANVINLRDVRFENDEDGTLGIPLIGGDSAAANGQTEITCAAGVCRVKTVSYARLYEKVNDDGTTTVINTGAKVVGTTMLELVVSGSRRQLAVDMEIAAVDDRKLQEEIGTAGFDLDVDLASPPSRNNASFAGSVPLMGSALVGLFVGLVLV